jgi:hypothetical protein
MNRFINGVNQFMSGQNRFPFFANWFMDGTNWFASGQNRLGVRNTVPSGAAYLKKTRLKHSKLRSGAASQIWWGEVGRAVRCPPLT